MVVTLCITKFNINLFIRYIYTLCIIIKIHKNNLLKNFHRFVLIMEAPCYVLFEV